MKSICFICILLFSFQLHALEEHSSFWKPINVRVDRLSDSLETIVREDGNRQKAISIVEEMMYIANKQRNRDLMVRAQYWKSWMQLKINTDSARLLINEALMKVDSINYAYDRARLQFNQGTLLIIQGDYFKAYLLYKELEQFFKEKGDNLFAGKVCINIGYLLNGLQEYQRALSYLEKAEEYFLKGGYTMQMTKNKLNIAHILSAEGRVEETRTILDSLLQNPVIQRDSVSLISAVLALGCISTDTVEHYRYYMNAYNIAQSIQDRTCLVYTSVNLGSYYSDYQFKLDSALFYYKQAYDYSRGNPDAYSNPAILYGLSETYASLHQVDSAYYYLKSYNILKDSLAGNDKIIEINRQESRMAIQKYESELQQAREKELLNRKIILVIFISIVFLSAFACYIFWLLRRKEKMEKQLKETENRELNEHLKNKILLNERFQLEIDSKNRELTSNALVISEKNQMLKALLKEIDQLGQEGMLPVLQTNKLKREIDSHLNDADEWQYFKLHFESVHPDFFLNLKQQFPNLSENELRLCAYIRIGMSTKQISQMLSVLPETVNMARYRMRKKMELMQDDSLEDFMRKF